METVDRKMALFRGALCFSSEEGNGIVRILKR
jgi:hypothetical protein